MNLSFILFIIFNILLFMIVMKIRIIKIIALTFSPALVTIPAISCPTTAGYSNPGSFQSLLAKCTSVWQNPQYLSDIYVPNCWIELSNNSWVGNPWVLNVLNLDGNWEQYQIWMLRWYSVVLCFMLIHNSWKTEIRFFSITEVSVF